LEKRRNFYSKKLEKFTRKKCVPKVRLRGREDAHETKGENRGRKKERVSDLSLPKRERKPSGKKMCLLGEKCQRGKYASEKVSKESSTEGKRERKRFPIRKIQRGIPYFDHPRES